jgi:hypothetical protein
MIKDEVLEQWAIKTGNTLTTEDYLGYQRFVILQQLKTLGIHISFDDHEENEIDCIKFASVVLDNIVKFFNVDEDDIGIMRTLKQDIERAKTSE